MQKVLVRHRVDNGRVVFSSKRIIQDVVHKYISGKIRTSSGDVWNVQEVSHNEYDFVTVETVQ